MFITGIAGAGGLLLMQRRAMPAGLHTERACQRLPRLAAGRGGPGSPGRRALSSNRGRRALRAGHQRAGPPRRCWARSASSPTPSARSTRVRAWYGGPASICAGDAIKHGNAGTAQRMAACWWWRATTTWCPRRCRTSPRACSRRSMPVAQRWPTWREILSSASMAGRCRATRAMGRADRAVGGGGKRHDGGPRCDQRTRRGVGDADAVRAADRPRCAGRRLRSAGLIRRLRIESRLHDKLRWCASRASTARP